MSNYEYIASFYCLLGFMFIFYQKFVDNSLTDNDFFLYQLFVIQVLFILHWSNEKILERVWNKMIYKN
jgi:hypothetical protein